LRSLSLKDGFNPFIVIINCQGEDREVTAEGRKREVTAEWRKG